MSRIALVVDEDAGTRELLHSELTAEGFACEWAGTGRAGLALCREWPPDLVVLARDLPDSTGHDVCRRIRGSSTVPIIMVDNHDDWVDRVVGLELGADDYLAGPIRTREFVERVRAHLRRAEEYCHTSRSPEVLDFQELRIDIQRRAVSVRGSLTHFPRKEFELLVMLARNEGRTLLTSRLLDAIWGDAGHAARRTLGVHVARVRSKIERDPHEPRVILTVPGVGYRFVSPLASGPAL